MIQFAFALAAALGVSTAVLPDQRQAAGATERRAAIDAKIDSQLLQAVRRQAGETRNLPSEPPRVDVDRAGRALVDVRAEVTDAMLGRVRKAGGRIVAASAEHRSIVARIPLKNIRSLAAVDAVRFIAPAAAAMTHSGREVP